MGHVPLQPTHTMSHGKRTAVFCNPGTARTPSNTAVLLERMAFLPDKTPKLPIGRTR